MSFTTSVATAFTLRASLVRCRRLTGSQSAPSHIISNSSNINALRHVTPQYTRDRLASPRLVARSRPFPPPRKPSSSLTPFSPNMHSTRMATTAAAAAEQTESGEPAAAASGGAGSVAMEVEVKLRLPSAEAHARVAELLAANHAVTHQQENVFFDGAKGELSSKRVNLRLRFYNGDGKCVVTVKGKTVMADGIGRSTEEEEEIDPSFGRSCVEDPSNLLTASSPLLQSLPSRFVCPSFVCLGGFRNERSVFKWEGDTIELDETKFAFGTQYEIECETSKPEELKKKLEKFLAENGVPFCNSSSTKFGIFRAGKLPEYAH